MIEQIKSVKKNDELADSYPHNKDYMAKYMDYQKRYNFVPRESDKKILLILDELFSKDADFSILDIGCSTGCLLKHIKHFFPKSFLVGGDLSEKQINFCKTDSELSGIDFEIMDVLNLKTENKFDVVVANAILWIFDQEKFELALKEIYSSLKPGGFVIVYDFFHKYMQEVSIIEHSSLFPEGLPLHFRSIFNVNKVLKEIGFDLNRFEPFKIGIDLPESNEPESIGTRTILSENERLCFRGILYQPWAFLVLQKN